ncbi:MAG: hypothetical protein ACREEM_47635 [Blastocatellia bacterium]
MTDYLKQIYNACDPYLPASPEYYLDCAEARGDAAFARRVRSHLKRANDHRCFLLSGHIGCGKSSELKKLEIALTSVSPGDDCYFPVLIDVSEYLDDYDVAATDILLAIVTELADSLRQKLNVELKDNYFTKRLNEIKQFFLSDVEINEGELELGFAKAKVQRLKKDPTARENVRKWLENHWDKLARLDLSDDQRIPNGDGDYLKMLENLSILEYINGGDADVFAEAEPWYAVNPIVRELKKFKAARLTAKKS